MREGQMIRTCSSLAAALLVLAACSSPSMQTASSTTSPQATEASTESTPAGRWTGQTAQGGSVVIDIPPSGSPTYSFRGQKLPVSSARMANGSMVMMVGTGAGRVTLTPQTIGDRVLGETGRALTGDEIRRPSTGVPHAAPVRWDAGPRPGRRVGASAAVEA